MKIPIAKTDTNDHGFAPFCALAIREVVSAVKVEWVTEAKALPLVKSCSSAVVCKGDKTAEFWL